LHLEVLLRPQENGYKTDVRWVALTDSAGDGLLVVADGVPLGIGTSAWPLDCFSDGIINRILRVVFMPMFGLVQAFMPVTGFNYGAKKYARVLETFKISNAWATYISIGLFLVMMIFAKPILHIFSNDAALIEAGTSALRLIMLFVPIVGFQIISTGYFQAIGKAVPSFFLAMSRQVLFLLPLILIMPLYFGLDGIWYSFPIADLLSVIAVTALIIPEIRLLKKSVPQTELIKSQKTNGK